MSRLYVKNLKRGMSVSDVFLVDTANFKQARNGSHFVQLVLRDATGSVKALRWESNPEEFRLLESNPFLLTNGRVEEYQGNLQIIVDEMTPLSAKDANVDPAEFLPRTAHDIDAMESELRAIVAGIERAPVRQLVEAILERPGARDGLRGAPAGKTMHHAYVGGLLEHVLSLSKLALNVCDHYPWLDRSILIAGVVLHDLGKIEELDYLSGFSYTAEGQLIGHIAMATQWIDEAARSIDGLDEETVLHLKHIVLSHHGRLEFGSPKVPATAEAMALHFLDNLDAKLAGYLDAFRNVSLTPDGDRFGDYNTMFATRLFFPRQLDQATHEPAGPTPGPAANSGSAPAPAEPKRR
ncbi:MAG: OB-fold nucleic acid binding domain-containing protein, partial [Planctomycetota bacterium]